MAEFSVKTAQIRGIADEEKKIESELNNIENAVQNISNNLSFNAASKSRIETRLKGIAGRIGESKRGMQGMHFALLGVVNNYEKTEARICEHAGGILAYEIQNTGSFGQTNYGQIDSQQNKEGTFITIPNLLTGGIRESIKNLKEDIIDETGFKVSAKTNGAYYSEKIQCEYGSAGVTVFGYEAYTNAEGGIFTKDEEGNLLFNPHINTKMGASFSVLTVEGTYATGNNILGTDISGEVTVGQISGEVEASASLRDSDGNINPHAKLDANAELILIDAKAQAGVTVLGTKAEVKGSVNVGVGAHANLEIGDGKIVCDIGASLGIGASISIAIDYGGTVNAIKDIANSALDIAKDVYDKLKFW